MFSIAAINDPDSRAQWEPLAPTKEAQESRLTQTYQEGLLQLHAGDYLKAQSLLESIIQDPLVASAEKDSSGRGDSMAQLRFLSLKNLANVFAKQGSNFYGKAIQYYLQAVEFDGRDVTVWNQLGTVACSYGSLHVARMAFEHGLKCSPNNWNCMEKLLEVLIAIGDDVACLALAKALLQKWPSHSRAAAVKKAIEQAPSACIEIFGTDKLEPSHVGLSFPKKRKAVDESFDNECPKKSKNDEVDVCLEEASWDALIHALLNIVKSQQSSDNGCCSSTKVSKYDDLSRNFRVNFFIKNKQIINVKAVSSSSKIPGSSLSKNTETNAGLSILDYCSNDSSDTVEVKERPLDNVSGDLLLNRHSKENTSVVRDKESLTDEEPPQERRSSRLERLRSRKCEREEFDIERGKEQAKHLRKMLDPYFVCDIGETGHSFLSEGCTIGCKDEKNYSSNHESDKSNVLDFLEQHSFNGGLYDILDFVLEKIAVSKLTHHSSFYDLIELEKISRHSNKSRSPLCSLFLAELCFDYLISCSEESRGTSLTDDASYYLCKIVEEVTINKQPFLEVVKGGDNVALSRYYSDPKSSPQVDLGFRFSTSAEAIHECEMDASVPVIDWSFWVRFSWLSGRLCTLLGERERGYKELQRCVFCLNNARKQKGMEVHVFVPHCKFMKHISLEIIHNELRALDIEALLRNSTAELIKNRKYSDLVELLCPVLFSNDKCVVQSYAAASRPFCLETSIELNALDTVIMACEKTNPGELNILLKCHKRRLEIFCIAAGIMEDASSLSNNGNLVCELEQEDGNKAQWNKLVSDEVKSISRCASEIKDEIEQHQNPGSFGIPIKLLGDLQVLILRVMCHMIKIFSSFKHSGVTGSGSPLQLESICFVDSAVAFCKIQHLDWGISVKKQVELLSLMHELLAEHELCCAGKECEGGEGAFLKLAIKQLLALEIKLKSSLASANIVDSVKQPLCQASETVLMRNSYSKGPNENEIYAGEDLCSKGENIALKENINNIHSGISEPKFEHVENTSEKEKSSGGAKMSGCDQRIIDSGQLDVIENNIDFEKTKVELGMDNVLDQCFFCLYGLNLKCGMDSSNDDGLAVHKNTSLGDYQTKEQCADVFKYLLPFAKASSRAGLVKLRRVLRAIRKQFPQPPDEVLKGNAIDLFLNDPDFNEETLRNMVISRESINSISEYAFQGAAKPIQSNKDERYSESNITNLVCGKNIDLIAEQFFEIYSNLYYIVAQAEEMSATDKFPSFVLTKEGEDYVQQNASLFKFDLLYNPLRFESWQKLASIYDEEVDLMLNDGSKHMNVLEWKSTSNLNQRVENSRQRIRRCSLMSLALAKTSEQQSQAHELLALVYYDSLQNVVPIYDQRHCVPARDSAWINFCQNSFKHFECAFSQKPEWSHPFYLGKLSEKLRHSPGKALSYYSKAASMNISVVDPVYRIHASRMKLLYKCGRHSPHAIKIAARYCFHHDTKEKVSAILASGCINPSPGTTQEENGGIQIEALSSDSVTEIELLGEKKLEEAWRLLFDDCIAALEICLEGELKHFHKARYMLAQGLYYRGEGNDLDRAKEQLSFCFKSNRSAFTFNMWEIDGALRKGRRKATGIGSLRKGLELGLPESSRKFITCIRKYILLYLILCEKTGDYYTLERAHSSIRSDKRFSTCLEDIAPIALRRFIQSLGTAVKLTEIQGSGNNGSADQLLEKMFNVFMEHGSIWPELAGISEVRNTGPNEFSETTFYSFIHRYLHSLEIENRIDVLELVNEKLRKRFKGSKLANVNCSKICKHASLALCRLLLTNLALITHVPVNTNESATVASESSTDYFLQLFVDIQSDEILHTSFDDSEFQKALGLKLQPILSGIRNVPVKKAAPENAERAVTLLRHAYNFFKESTYVTMSKGINLYTLPSSSIHHQGQSLAATTSKDVASNVEELDLSTPRKLVLWAYTLVYGRYCNISAVLKHCEDNAKFVNMMT